VDAIDFFTSKIKDIDMQIEDKMSSQPAMTDVAFVTFEKIVAASLGAQATLSNKPHQWINSQGMKIQKHQSLTLAAAPDPADILWEKLSVNHASRMIRSVLGDKTLVLTELTWPQQTSLLLLLCFCG
jgi:hypothetical protein